MLADPIAEVLAGHVVSVDWYRRRNGYAWSCSCLVDGQDVHRLPDGAHRAAAGHQAQQVRQALAQQVPAVAGEVRR